MLRLPQSVRDTVLRRRRRRRQTVAPRWVGQSRQVANAASWRSLALDLPAWQRVLDLSIMGDIEGDNTYNCWANDKAGEPSGPRLSPEGLRDLVQAGIDQLDRRLRLRKTAARESWTEAGLAIDSDYIVETGRDPKRA
jgi:hypothetical protein